MFPFVGRAAWGARAPKRVVRMSSVAGMFVHYRGPGGAPSGQAAESAALRQDQDFHMDVRGWSDIAYSWAVGQSGLIYELRGWGVTGGHTLNWNSKSHAVLWIGGEDAVPSAAAFRSLAAVVNEHRRMFAGFVKAHRDVNATACPGDPLAGWVHTAAYLSGSQPSAEDDMTPEERQWLADTLAVAKDTNQWVKGVAAKLDPDKLATAIAAKLPSVPAGDVKEAVKAALKEGTG